MMDSPRTNLPQLTFVVNEVRSYNVVAVLLLLLLLYIFLIADEIK